MKKSKLKKIIIFEMLKYNKMDKDFIKENPLLTVSTLVLYFGACAGLWHIGFWSVFDVNYLQYIEISDIIKDFAQPSFSSAISTIFAILLAGLQHMLFSSNVESKVQESEGHKKKGKENKKIAYILLAIVVISLITLYLFSNQILRYTLIPVFIGYTASFLMVNKGFLSKQIPNFGFRFTAITFLVLLPAVSFFHARAESLEIKENHKYKYVSSIQFGEEIHENVIGLKLIGVAKTNLFLTDYCNNSIVILNMENINSIRYKKVDIKINPVSFENLRNFFRSE